MSEQTLTKSQRRPFWKALHKEEYVSKLFGDIIALGNKEIDDYQKSNWIDHTRFVKIGEAECFVSEPYGIGLEDLKLIVELCERHNFKVRIDGLAKHAPGNCCRIVIWRKGELPLRFREIIEET